jgi:hypothetical protein
LFALICVAIVPIGLVKFSPDGERIETGLGGGYESNAPVLRGNWICGGPLVFQAAVNPPGRPSHTVPVTGSFVSRESRLGARTRCVSISFARAHYSLRP